MHTTLPASALRWRLPVDDFSADDLRPKEEDRHGRPGALGQERALAALELGLGIRERGFNIFVVGASGTGRTSTVRELLEEKAKTEPAPSDIVLLYNFTDRDRPHAVQVPPGAGPGIKKRYDGFVEKMLQVLEKAFESDGYIDRRSQLDAHHQEKTDALLVDIDKEAGERGFILSRTGSALTLAVADDDGNPLSEEAYEALDDDKKAELESGAEELQSGLEEALRKIRALEKETDEAIEKLARETAAQVVHPLVEEAKADLAATSPRVGAHLDDVEKDILDRLRRLVPESHAIEEGGEEAQAEPRSAKRLSEEEEDGDRDEPALLRYRVNVLVTQNPKAGAPVVLETLPTLSNLVGRIEHRVRQGESSTDFTRIKAGALYRANGGYLLLHAADLLRDPAAWEGLKRALKNRQIELDDPGEPGRMVTMAALRPEPVKLSVKICLIGVPELYYALSRGDPDFSKLFKVKVDFEIEMARSKDRLLHYMRFLSGLSHEEKLLPLTIDGAGRVLEHAARLCDDQNKLTTRFGEIADLVREASFFAQKEQATQVSSAHVKKALLARADREGFIELRMREDIAARRVSIQTEGAVVGQVNGLTVIDLGSYAFGSPVRITCRVGAGRGEIVDIERETELGGPIHTKGTLIIKGLLLDRFGRHVPLCLQGTVCMEQSYSDIDGDSASLAEVCALISALAGIPLRQDVAMTGSVDQLGNAQAVGGVNEKIEGFFHVCRERDPARVHEVIIPASNARDLMLDEEIVDACNKGLFKVTTVETVEDALFILTGERWNGPGAAGSTSTKPGIFARALAALDHLAAVQSIVNLQPRGLRRTSSPGRAPKTKKSASASKQKPTSAASKKKASAKGRNRKP
jgi:lon-related putative ATP-dependent protease